MYAFVFFPVDCEVEAERSNFTLIWFLVSYLDCVLMLIKLE